MTEKLILQRQKYRNTTFKVCKIDSDTHALLQKISQETGLQMYHVIGEMIEFAINNLEITED